ncbi:glutathione S-transferase family protein [Hirschia maritima]|uniref:glutathione S-transferase family protein n=1 Tax=Hirschia maritima TaxID=1121961 RepID=UPI000369BBCD|nr:glutathione S-transferase [Hirschia maritima]
MNTKFPTNATPIKLYRNVKSGHCHRVELLMSFLGLPYEAIEVDMANGAHKKPEFVANSPFGQVPVIDDNGTKLADSNAILTYLIHAYSDEHQWLPNDPVKAAKVQQWLSVSAGQIASGPAAARLVPVFGAQLDWDKAKAIANDLFKVMDAHLSNSDYLIGDDITIADVSAYSYVAHAPEGGVSLTPYPAIQNWLERIEARQGFVAMPESAIPA